MDLVRKILLACEREVHGFAPSQLSIEGYTEEQVGYHIYIMCQARLISGLDSTGTGDSSPCWMATAVTWEGHEFLETSRDDKLWVKAKHAAGSAGGMALDVLKAVLVGLATDAAKKAAGLP
jgi:hypothetical protein